MNTPGTCKIIKSKTWHTFENFPATLVVLPEFSSKGDPVNYEAEADMVFHWLRSIFCTAMLMKLRDQLNDVLGTSKIR